MKQDLNQPLKTDAVIPLGTTFQSLGDWSRLFRYSLSHQPYIVPEPNFFFLCFQPYAGRGKEEAPQQD